MRMKDEDRKTILRRRAFFVTSALAALGGCARPTTGPSATPGDDKTVQVPVAPDDPIEADAGEPPERAPSSARSGLPPTDVPDGVKPITRSYYENLYQVVADLHRHIDAIEASIGRCKGFDKDCEKNQLPQIATAMNAIDDTLERIQSCGGRSPEAKAYMVREAEHMGFASKRRGQMEDSLKQLLASGGAAAEKSLKSLREAGAVPRPCLEYACPEW
jgi:hypothetical protein